MSLEDEIHAVWVDPTQFDPLRCGPPFLPEQRTMKQASNPEILRTLASEYQGPYGYLAALLVCLRSTSWIHLAHHWTTKGQSYYGDHLLFMRIYEEGQEFEDQVAEKLIGLANPTFVNPVIQAKQLAWCISQCYAQATFPLSPEEMIQISLKKETEVVTAVTTVLEALREMGASTDGLENLLQGVADKHEEFLYLLKQRATVATYSYGR